MYPTTRTQPRLQICSESKTQDFIDQTQFFSNKTQIQHILRVFQPAFSRNMACVQHVMGWCSLRLIVSHSPNIFQ